MAITFSSKEYKGLRLDKFLCKKFDISFGLAQKLIREKKVVVNGARANPSYKVKDLDQVEIFSNLKSRYTKQKQEVSEKKMKKFLSAIVFEDENLVALNKPSGLATQGGSKIDISVEDFIFKKKWQLVHRLDKDTSGVLLLAKNQEAVDFFFDAFKGKTIKKTYMALIYGIPKKLDGIVNIPLQKKFLGQKEKVFPDFEFGKEAITKFKVLERFNNYSLIELSPITGRTHQLRVHCKELGHPILNDVKYGGKKVIRKDLCSRLCLHAHSIEVQNYFGTTLNIKTKLPDWLIFSKNH